MTLSEIQCDACLQLNSYVYTTDYFGTGVSGYYCTYCFYYYSEESFAERYPDYDQSGDHSL